MSLDIEKALPFTTPLPPKYTFCAHGETPCRDCIIRWDLEDRARIRHELRIERRRRNDSCDGPGIIIAIPAIMLTAIVFFLICSLDPKTCLIMMMFSGGSSSDDDYYA